MQFLICCPTAYIGWHVMAGIGGSYYDIKLILIIWKVSIDVIFVRRKSREDIKKWYKEIGVKKRV